MSRSKDNFVIELVGLPGSGKSYTARQLCSEGGFQMIRWQKTRSSMLAAIVSSLSMSIFWLLAIVLESLSVEGFHLLRYKISLFANTLKRVKESRAFLGAPIIVDEGFWQRTLSIFERVKSKQTMLRFLERSMQPDYLVVVERQPPTFQRFEADNSRADLGEQYLKKWKEVMSLNYQTIKNIVSESDIPHCFVRNDADVSLLIEQIRKSVDKLPS